jgi:S-adenosylmethionine:diacylglycerol 3-amino-3-carboxypropyl transferase
LRDGFRLRTQRYFFQNGMLPDAQRAMLSFLTSSSNCFAININIGQKTFKRLKIQKSLDIVEGLVIFDNPASGNPKP